MKPISSDLETSPAPASEPSVKPGRRSSAKTGGTPGEDGSTEGPPRAKRSPRKKAAPKDDSQPMLPIQNAPTAPSQTPPAADSAGQQGPTSSGEARFDRPNDGGGGYRNQRGPRENFDNRDQRGPRENPDNRDQRGPRENPDNRDQRGPRENPDNRDQRGPRENPDNRDQRGPRENPDNRDQRGPRENFDNRDGRENRKFRKKNRHKKKFNQGQGGGFNQSNGGGPGNSGGDFRNQRSQDSEYTPVEVEPTGPAIEAQGLVEISPKGFGFLRQRDRGFAQSPLDVFVTPEVVRIHGLRDGLMVKCLARQGQRGPQLTEILTINGQPPEKYHNLPYFEELTAINPNKRIVLETRSNRATTRVIDLMTPIGRGQRGLIVAPPRTGKTTILQHLAEAIQERYPEEMHLMILLIDERPEEVTDFQRSFPNADIMASSNDSDIKSHTRIAQLAIERAKRLVEAGEHVFLLLDSITRLARAFNNAASGGNGGNRGTQSGGIAVGALEIPRRLFAAARNTREGGSLTIIATALIQTNSKMDDAIFQEFKGTGNMELVLDRLLSQNYVYPSVDIHRSGTRREELLLPAHMLEKIHFIRRGLAGYKPVEAMEWMLKLMERFPNNAQMLVDLKAPNL